MILGSFSSSYGLILCLERLWKIWGFTGISNFWQLAKKEISQCQRLTTIQPNNFINRNEQNEKVSVSRSVNFKHKQDSHERVLIRLRETKVWKDD